MSIVKYLDEVIKDIRENINCLKHVIMVIKRDFLIV